jgi:hypothetical protein
VIRETGHRQLSMHALHAIGLVGRLDGAPAEVLGGDRSRQSRGAVDDPDVDRGRLQLRVLEVPRLGRSSRRGPRRA